MARAGMTAAGVWYSWAAWVGAQPMPELPPELPILPEALATPSSSSGSSGNLSPVLPTIPVPSLTGEAAPAPSPAPALSEVNPSAPADPPVMPAMTAVPPIPVVNPDYTLQRLPDANPGVVPSQRGEIPAGTVIALTVFREITFQPYQAINTHLQVVNPVTDRNGTVIIPPGSTVWGLFEPVYEEVDPDHDVKGQRKRRFLGNRFVANRVTTPEGTYVLQGSTDLIPTRMDPAADVGQVALEGAGYGAAGGLALGILTGGVGFLPILAGTLAGAATGTTNVDQVVALHPNSVVQMELAQPVIVQ